VKELNQDKVEYWRNHLEQSKRYPEGIQAYCEANKLAPSNYYKWRQRLLDLPPAKIILKKPKSPFLPVTVSSATEFEIQSDPQTKKLPDSRWVAEIITNVIRGLM
jgi:hypothetical protein